MLIHSTVVDKTDQILIEWKLIHNWNSLIQKQDQKNIIQLEQMHLRQL